MIVLNLFLIISFILIFSLFCFSVREIKRDKKYKEKQEFYKKKNIKENVFIKKDSKFLKFFTKEFLVIEFFILLIIIVCLFFVYLKDSFFFTEIFLKIFSIILMVICFWYIDKIFLNYLKNYFENKYYEHNSETFNIIYDFVLKKTKFASYEDLIKQKEKEDCYKYLLTKKEFDIISDIRLGIYRNFRNADAEMLDVLEICCTILEEGKYV